MKKHFCWIALVLIFSACSKNKSDDGNNGNNNGTTGTGGSAQLGAGIVYYDWATEGALKVDLKTGVKGTFLAYNTRRNSWDVSQDNTWLLESTDDPDNYDGEVYTI